MGVCFVCMSAANEIWVEKYRPDTLDEIRGNDTLVNRLKEFVDDDSMPNIMFTGPQGVGKTAAARAFAKDKYGDDWQAHFTSLNASDERGIDTVRDKIKSHARTSTVSEHQFKIVFLDEADHLTRSAQPALRRIMEDFHDRTRFFLSCNYPNKIIDPIQSRCSVFSMSPLESDNIYDLIKDIADTEGLDYSPDQLERITRIADGDARKAILTLQSSTNPDGELEDKNINMSSAFPDRETVSEIVDKTLVGDHSAMEDLDDFLASGIDTATLANVFLKEIKSREDLPEDARMKMIDKIGDVEWRVINGSNPNVQFNSLLATMFVARHINVIPNYDTEE